MHAFQMNNQRLRPLELRVKMEILFHEVNFISISAANVANPSQSSVQFHFHSYKFIDRNQRCCFGIAARKRVGKKRFKCEEFIPTFMLHLATRKKVVSLFLYLAPNTQQKTRETKEPTMSGKNIISIILVFKRTNGLIALCSVHWRRVLFAKFGLIQF